MRGIASIRFRSTEASRAQSRAAPATIEDDLTNHAPGLTRSSIAPRSMAGGVMWNAAGQAVPALAALVLIPHLIEILGVGRFGILSLAWVLIGYFTLFDLGVSVAVTRLVAQQLGRGRGHDVAPVVGTALAIAGLMGAVGGAILIGTSRWLVGTVLGVPAALRAETEALVGILAVTLPIVTATAVFTGLLSAQRRFAALNLIRIPLGVLTYAAPVLAVTRGPDLVAAGFALAGVRVAAGLAYAVAGWRGVGAPRSAFVPRADVVRRILGFGSWTTLSAVVGPVMVSLDRFVIGAMGSVAVVAYYTAPFDMISRLTLLSMPLVGALFPAVAASHGTNPAGTARLFGGSLRVAGALLFPPAFVVAVFAPEILAGWLGQDFADRSSTTLRLLAIGVFVNGLAQLALALVQAAGRPDLAARLHVAELPVYLVILAWWVGDHGIAGAAAAWLARATVDALALFAFARALLRPASFPHRVLVVCAAAALAIAAGCLITDRIGRGVFASTVLAAFAILAWRTVARPRAMALRGGPGS